MRFGPAQFVTLGVVVSIGWAANQVAAGRSTVELPGVSHAAVSAYVVGAEWANRSHPGCTLSWQLLAGIGAVETGHGTFAGAKLDGRGVASPPIRGPRLDGGEFALILDTDGGALDGDPEYDRAVGPMQFIPASWRAYRPDPGADPQNIFDATKAAGALLCTVADSESRPLTDPAVEEAAIRSYNDSADYVRTVRGFRDDFRAVAPGGARGTGEVTPAAVAGKLGEQGRQRWQALGRAIAAAPGDYLDRAFEVVDPSASLLWATLDPHGVADPFGLSSTASTAGMVTVRGITVAGSIADAVGRLIDAAAADGVTLTGSGYRDSTEQAALRAQNCPDPANSDPGECTPATAKVGTSNHERGLAIDFADGAGVSLGAGSAGFRWLSQHAERFGLRNLPSEPWHWSVDGR